MTNYEFLKNAELEEMGKYLCYMISTNEDSEDPCGECFASGYCFIANNGMQNWLEEEYRRIT